MTDKAVTYEEVVEVVAKATAMYYAHNRMPVMSGNPLDRLHPSLKRDCYDGARAALSAIRKAGVRLMPSQATEEMLEGAGPMEGWAEYAHPDDADRCHEEWYEAAVAAGEIKLEGGE